VTNTVMARAACFAREQYPQQFGDILANALASALSARNSSYAHRVCLIAEDRPMRALRALPVERALASRSAEEP